MSRKPPFPIVVRPVQLASLGVLALGVGLIVASLLAGGSRLYLVLLIIPVLSGNSVPFLAGVLLTFLGFFGFLASFAGEATGAGLDEDGTTEHVEGGARSAAGGVLLIGPIPIFFGAAKPAQRRYYLLALLAAVVLFAGVLVLAFLL